MVTFYKWFLAIPVLILALSFYILLSGEAIIGKVNPGGTGSTTSNSPTAERSRHIPGKSTPSATVSIADLRTNRESVYPYFLLGTGLLVVLLILPKLSELSFSPTNGVTIKVLNEVAEAIEEVKTSAQAVELKAKQAFSPHAPETLMAPRPDLTDEIKKLEESSAKLNVYANLLEKLNPRKGK